MIALLRAEGRAALNLARQRDGRRLLGAHAVTLGCIAAGALLVGRATVASPPVLDALRADASGAAGRLLFSLLVAAPALLIGSLALAQARSELFEGATAPLLLASPRPRASIVAGVAGRLVLRGLGFGLALGLPLFAPVLVRGDELSWLAAAAYPPALAVAALPLVALGVLASVAMQRFLAGRIARAAAALALLTLGVAALVGVVVGWSGGERAGRAVGDLLAGATGGAGAVAGPGDLVAAAAGIPADVARAAASCLGLVVLAAAAVGVAAALLPRAFERSLLDEGAALRGGAGAWPRGAARSVLHREWLALRQQPGQLVLYGLIAVPCVWFARSAALPEVLVMPAAAEWSWELTMHGLWLILMVLGSLLVASVASDDARQLDLLRTAPAPRRALLLGRMLGVSMPLAWVLVSSVAAAALLTDAGPAALALHAAAGSALCLVALGGVAAFGTLATMVRGADGRETPSATWVVAGILAESALLFGAWWVLQRARDAVRTWHGGGGPLADLPPPALAALLAGALLLGGLAVAALGFLAGVRNTERLLGPER